MKSAAPENLQVLDDDALDSAKGGAGSTFGFTVHAVLEPRFTLVPRLPPLPTLARPRPPVPLPDPPPFRELPSATQSILLIG